MQWGCWKSLANARVQVDVPPHDEAIHVQPLVAHQLGPVLYLQVAGDAIQQLCDAHDQDCLQMTLLRLRGWVQQVSREVGRVPGRDLAAHVAGQANPTATQAVQDALVRRQRRCGQHIRAPIKATSPLLLFLHRILRLRCAGIHLLWERLGSGHRCLGERLLGFGGRAAEELVVEAVWPGALLRWLHQREGTGRTRSSLRRVFYNLHGQANQYGHHDIWPSRQQSEQKRHDLISQDGSSILFSLNTG